jgi:hypothetical protein
VNRKQRIIAAAILLVLSSGAPARLGADDFYEIAGVATGVTAGNMIAPPLKAVSMVIGALSGALSFIVTLGDTEVTKQVWRDTFQGPYVVTPELARMSVGRRPELEMKK